MKKVRVILSTEAEKAYKDLEKHSTSSATEKGIFNSIKTNVELIKVNHHSGDPISKKLIPERYRNEFRIKNLFRVELSNHWRMLYTLTNGDSIVEIIAFVLDIVDHKTYDKTFGYKKK